MSGNLLQTKLYTPKLRPSLVPRPRLIDKLNAGRGGKLTLISAPAGFGKTTLVTEWLHQQNIGEKAADEKNTMHASSFIPHPSRAAWLSMDEGDADLKRFLTYLVAALQTIAADIGESVLTLIQSPQLPPIESILTALLNDIAAVPDNFIFVLDDYHLADARPVDQALAFLLDNLPPQMHLVITTREDPNLPLARLRVRNQLTELRVADLRFTLDEASDFLHQSAGVDLNPADVTTLTDKTEGWIAGLQLAAISLQGHDRKDAFVRAFAGDNRHIADYLLDEALLRQPAHIQTFLLQTSILDRLSAPLCDVVTCREDSQAILAELERANLFLIPLDNQRICSSQS